MNPELSKRLRAWLPVTLCTLLLPLCALFVRPWVEIGTTDDWSYIRTAQILAQTGHLVYNGWATAMLGWQLYAGALMIKLFGFSFTAPRVATLLAAAGSGALMQRVYVRLGVSEWNSAAITVIFLSSPPWMAMTFSFMSDVYGMLVLLACCYCCLRAVQTSSETRAVVWISVAALGTGIGGTARQIAWVGVLVMVPCTLWLLRRNRRALWIGGLCTLAGIAMVPLSLAWFNHQPYALPESAIPAKAISIKLLLRQQLPNFLEVTGFELLFLAAPLLLTFLAAVARSRRALLAMGLAVLYWALRVRSLLHAHALGQWIAPYLGNNLWFYGWDELPAYVGTPALLLTRKVRLVLTVTVFAAELGLLGLLAFRRRARLEDPSRDAQQSPTMRRWQIAWILGPCTLAYLTLLLPRYLGGGILDRYTLFLEFVLLGVAVLLYQGKIAARLPAMVWLLAGLYLVVNIMGMHDTFSLFRAQASLLDRLQAMGVPRTQLDGGIIYNGWTEIVEKGHLNDPRIRIPAGVYKPVPVISVTDPCHTEFLELTPSIHAKYVVSFNPDACGGQTGIQESFHTWLGPRSQTLYAVRGPA